jgi:hypothetical protein
MATLCCFEKPGSYYTVTVLHYPADWKHTFWAHTEGGEKLMTVTLMFKLKCKNIVFINKAQKNCERQKYKEDFS